MFVLLSYVEILVRRKIINECCRHLCTVFLAVLFTYTQILVNLKLDTWGKYANHGHMKNYIYTTVVVKRMGTSCIT